MEGFKKDIDSNTIILGNFNTPLSKWTDLPKKSTNNAIVELNNILDQMNLTDKYRAFHSKVKKYTFFSSTHGKFSNMDHMIRHETSLNKFKKIEVISRISYDHKGLKLETNPKGKNSQTLRLMEIE